MGEKSIAKTQTDLSEENVTLSITGMTCAACATRIEKNIAKVPGVQKANVNLATEKASVIYDPAVASVNDVIAKIKKTGYGVQEEKVQLDIIGMTCASCSTRVEKGLKKVEGVTSAAVNLATEKAIIEYIPGNTNIEQIMAAVKKVGYDARVVGDSNDDYERSAREKEYKTQVRKFTVGAILSVFF